MLHPEERKNLFRQNTSAVAQATRSGQSDIWDSIFINNQDNDKERRIHFIKYIYGKECTNEVKKPDIQDFIGLETSPPTPPVFPESIDRTHEKLFELFLLDCTTNSNKQKQHEDPNRTGGFPNWAWGLIFFLIALGPVIYSVGSIIHKFSSNSIPQERGTPIAAPKIDSPQSDSESPINSKTSQPSQSTATTLPQPDNTGELKEKIAVIDGRLEDIYSTVEAVGLSAGLFGVLITIISIFFALKESERVKDALNRINELEALFKSFDTIKRQAASARDDARYAEEKSNRAREQAIAAERKAQEAETTAGKAKDIADGAKDIADGAKNIADGAKNIADGAKNTADGAKNTADEAKNTADGAKNTADEAKNIANGAKNTADEAKNIADGAKNIADGAKNTANKVIKDSEIFTEILNNSIQKLEIKVPNFGEILSKIVPLKITGCTIKDQEISIPTRNLNDNAINFLIDNNIIDDRNQLNTCTHIHIRP